ncbi:Rib/alpha-like domain-containing protein, partial [Lactobacillus iners]|uniref:sialoglycan-binding domain-containing protein n=1 Tax=Lactobacillus iners TaxID=147802 RepID=UPI00255054D5
MFGKNNKKMRDLEQREKVTYYGIRKFSVGVVSVAISAAFLLSGQTRYVLADEQPAIESRNNKQLVISKQEQADDGVNSKANNTQSVSKQATNTQLVTGQTDKISSGAQVKKAAPVAEKHSDKTQSAKEQTDSLADKTKANQSEKDEKGSTSKRMTEAQRKDLTQAVQSLKQQIEGLKTEDKKAVEEIVAAYIGAQAVLSDVNVNQTVGHAALESLKRTQSLAKQLVTLSHFQSRSAQTGDKYDVSDILNRASAHLRQERSIGQAQGNREYNEKLLGSYTELGGGGSGYDLYTQIFRNKRNGLFGQDPNFDGMNISNAEKDVWARVTPLEDGSGYSWEIHFNLGRNDHQHPKYFFTVPKNQKITKATVVYRENDDKYKTFAANGENALKTIFQSDIKRIEDTQAEFSDDLNKTPGDDGNFASLVYPANNGKWVNQHEITDPKMHPEWKDRLDQDAKRRNQLINKIKDNSQTVYFIQPHNGKNGYSVRFETKGPLERDKNTRKYYLAGFRSQEYNTYNLTLQMYGRLDSDISVIEKYPLHVRRNGRFYINQGKAINCDNVYRLKENGQKVDFSFWGDIDKAKREGKYKPGDFGKFSDAKGEDLIDSGYMVLNGGKNGQDAHSDIGKLDLNRYLAGEHSDSWKDPSGKAKWGEGDLTWTVYDNKGHEHLLSDANTPGVNHFQFKRMQTVNGKTETELYNIMFVIKPKTPSLSQEERVGKRLPLKLTNAAGTYKNLVASNGTKGVPMVLYKNVNGRFEPMQEEYKETVTETTYNEQGKPTTIKKQVTKKRDLQVVANDKGEAVFKNILIEDGATYAVKTVVYEKQEYIDQDGSTKQKVESDLSKEYLAKIYTPTLAETEKTAVNDAVNVQKHDTDNLLTSEEANEIKSKIIKNLKTKFGKDYDKEVENVQVITKKVERNKNAFPEAYDANKLLGNQDTAEAGDAFIWYRDGGVVKITRDLTIRMKPAEVKPLVGNSVQAGATKIKLANFATGAEGITIFRKEFKQSQLKLKNGKWTIDPTHNNAGIQSVDKNADGTLTVTFNESLNQGTTIITQVTDGNDDKKPFRSEVKQAAVVARTDKATYPQQVTAGVSQWNKDTKKLTDEAKKKVIADLEQKITGLNGNVKVTINDQLISLGDTHFISVNATYPDGNQDSHSVQLILTDDVPAKVTMKATDNKVTVQNQVITVQANQAFSFQASAVDEHSHVVHDVRTENRPSWLNSNEGTVQSDYNKATNKKRNTKGSDKAPYVVTLSGTAPMKPGTHVFTVKTWDGANPENSGSQQVTLKVEARPLTGATQTVEVNDTNALSKLTPESFVPQNVKTGLGNGVTYTWNNGKAPTNATINTTGQTVEIQATFADHSPSTTIQGKLIVQDTKLAQLDVVAEKGAKVEHGTAVQTVATNVQNFPGNPPTLTTYVNEPMTVHVKVTDNSNKVTDAKLNGNSSFVQSNDREYQKNNRSKKGSAKDPYTITFTGTPTTKGTNNTRIDTWDGANTQGWVPLNIVTKEQAAQFDGQAVSGDTQRVEVNASTTNLKPENFVSAATKALYKKATGGVTYTFTQGKLTNNTVTSAQGQDVSITATFSDHSTRTITGKLVVFDQTNPTADITVSSTALGQAPHIEDKNGVKEVHVYGTEDFTIKVQAHDNSGKVAEIALVQNGKPGSYPFPLTSQTSGVGSSAQPKVLTLTGATGKNTNNQSDSTQLSEGAQWNNRAIQVKDGSNHTTIINLRVINHQQTTKYDPQVQAVTVKASTKALPEAKSAISNVKALPNGAQYTWVNGSPVTQSGKRQVKVTYPDGSSDTVDVIVTYQDDVAPTITFPTSHTYEGVAVTHFYRGEPVDITINATDADSNMKKLWLSNGDIHRTERQIGEDIKGLNVQSQLNGKNASYHITGTVPTDFDDRYTVGNNQAVGAKKFTRLFNAEDQNGNKSAIDNSTKFMYIVHERAEKYTASYGQLPITVGTKSASHSSIEFKDISKGRLFAGEVANSSYKAVEKTVDKPNGTTFTLMNPVDGVQIDSTTGKLTLQGQAKQVGQTIPIKVKVTYSDKSFDIVDVSMKIRDDIPADVQYEAGKGSQVNGTTVTVYANEAFEFKANVTDNTGIVYDAEYNGDNLSWLNNDKQTYQAKYKQDTNGKRNTLGSKEHPYVLTFTGTAPNVKNTTHQGKIRTWDYQDANSGAESGFTLVVKSQSENYTDHSDLKSKLQGTSQDVEVNNEHPVQPNAEQSVSQTTKEMLKDKGVTYSWKTNHVPDTQTVGEKTGIVVVTFKDGSTLDISNAKVNVKDTVKPVITGWSISSDWKGEQPEIEDKNGVKEIHVYGTENFTLTVRATDNSGLVQSIGVVHNGKAGTLGFTTKDTLTGTGTTADPKQLTMIGATGPNIKDKDGYSNRTFKVTDAAGNSVEQQFKIVVHQQTTKYEATVAAGVIEKDYGATLTEEEIKAKVSVPQYSQGKPAYQVSLAGKLPSTTSAGNHQVDVKVTYPDGSTDIVQVPVSIKAQPQKDAYELTYAPEQVEPGKSLTTQVPTLKKGNETIASQTGIVTSYSIAEDLKTKGYSVTNEGRLTIPASESATKVGQKLAIAVQVTYRDGTTENTIAQVSVTSPNKIDRTNDKNAPIPSGYLRVTLQAGEGTIYQGDAQAKTYDVKVNTALESADYPQVTSQANYRPYQWSVAAGTLITETMDPDKNNQVTIESTATLKTAVTIEPRYGTEKGAIGETIIIGSPTFYKENNGQVTTDVDQVLDRRMQYTLDKANDHVTIDASTGVIHYTPIASELNGKDEETVTIPVTVTYDDRSIDKVNVTVTIKRATSAEPTPVAPHTQSKEITGTGEKGAKISVAFPGGKTATGQVDEHGKFKVGVPTGVSLTKDQEITVTQTETNKKPTSKTVKVVPSQADGLKKPTEKVWVDNDKKLSPSEQKSVKDKVEELNKKDNQKPTVTVGDNGETTVVFPDGSQATIPGNELVQEKGQSAEPTPVAPHTQSKEITGTGEKGAK